MVVNREADCRKGPRIDESDAISFVAFYGILWICPFSLKGVVWNRMALTSKYDPPVPAEEYCPKPLMVYTLLIDYRDIEKVHVRHHPVRAHSLVDLGYPRAVQSCSFLNRRRECPRTERYSARRT
jgi:hypothetical protein